MSSCQALERCSNCRGAKWTEFMGEVMDGIGKSANCTVIRSRETPKKDNPSSEYLNIDAFFFDNRDYDIPDQLNIYRDPLVLPEAIIELENSFDTGKIIYCAWKLICVRAPTKVLICYQKNKDSAFQLARKLDGVINNGNLMKGEVCELLLIVGDESASEQTEWKDYFSIFKWDNDKFSLAEND